MQTCLVTATTFFVLILMLSRMDHLTTVSSNFAKKYPSGYSCQQLTEFSSLCPSCFSQILSGSTWSFGYVYEWLSRTFHFIILGVWHEIVTCVILKGSVHSIRCHQVTLIYCCMLEIYTLYFKRLKPLETIQLLILIKKLYSCVMVYLDVLGPVRI